MPQTPAINKVFERTLVPLTLVDAREDDMPLIRVSDAFCETTGYRRGECLGRNCRFLQGDDLQQPARFELRDALNEGTDLQVVLRNYMRDGTPFDNLLFIHHIRDFHGKVVYVMGAQFLIRDQESADSLNRHLRDPGSGMAAAGKSEQSVHINVKRQISASTSAMLHSAVLQDALAKWTAR